MVEDKPKKELEKEQINKPVVEIISSPIKNKMETDGQIENKKSYVNMKISRKFLYFFGSLLVVGVFAFLVWQYKWYQPVLDRYNKASVVVKIKEDDKFVVSKAKVVINNNEYITDDSGKVSFSTIAGEYVIRVEKDGYAPFERSIIIKRGDNDLFSFSIKKLAEKLFSVKGSVQDYVTSEAILDAQITLGSKTVNSNPMGEFSFEGIAPSEVKLIITKSGYINKEIPLSIVDADILNNKIEMVPTGRLIFVSNRDGKRKLYVSNYDGKDQKALADSSANGEDFAPFLSPDGKWVFFSSTRDGLKDSYGSDASVFYIIGIDGKNLRKVGDYINGFNVQWSQNSRYIYFEAYNSTKMDKSVYSIYDQVNQKNLEVGDIVNSGSFSRSGDVFVYSTNFSENKITSPSSPSLSPEPSSNPEAVLSNSNQTITVYQVKSFNLENGERKVLASRDQYISNMRFTSLDDVLGYDVVIEGSRRRFEISVSGGDEKEVPVQSLTSRNYIVQPRVGGAKPSFQVFIEQRDGKNDLYLVDMNEKNEKKLTNLGVVSSSLPPTWDGGGKYVIFAVKREAESALYIVSSSGKGEPKKVTDYFAEAGYRGY